MLYQANLQMQSQSTTLHEENIEVAIRLYEGSRTFREEERWLGLLETALQSLLVFTAEDLQADVRTRHKDQHIETLNGLNERIQKRKNGDISKLELARDLRLICAETHTNQARFKPLP